MDGSAIKTAWLALAVGGAFALFLMTLPVFVFAAHDDASLSGEKTVRLMGSSSDQAAWGWPIQLYDEDGELLDTDTTDAGGDYLFENLSAGTYHVCEAVSLNFKQTHPRSITNLRDSDVEVVQCPNGTWGYEVEISEGEEKDGLDFRNEKAAAPKLVVACAVGPSITASIGQRVTFGAATNRREVLPFVWSGDVSGSGETVSAVFSSTGVKTAMVTATEGSETLSANCSVTIIAAALPAGGVGGVPGLPAQAGEGPIGQQESSVTPPAETDTDEGADEATEGESAEGASAVRDNLWWIVLAVIVIALAGYYFWERQRGTTARPGKPERKEEETPPSPTPPAQQ